MSNKGFEKQNLNQIIHIQLLLREFLLLFHMIISIHMHMYTFV